MREVEAVSGGVGVLDISSAAGHLGRALGAGWAVGTMIYRYATTDWGGMGGGAYNDMGVMTGGAGESSFKVTIK